MRTPDGENEEGGGEEGGKKKLIQRIRTQCNDLSFLVFSPKGLSFLGRVLSRGFPSFCFCFSFHLCLLPSSTLICHPEVEDLIARGVSGGA